MFFSLHQTSDTLLLLWPGDEELGGDADLLLSSIMAQGLPTPVHVITGLEEMAQKVCAHFLSPSPFCFQVLTTTIYLSSPVTVTSTSYTLFITFVNIEILHILSIVIVTAMFQSLPRMISFLKPIDGHTTLHILPSFTFTAVF